MKIQNHSNFDKKSNQKNKRIGIQNVWNFIGILETRHISYSTFNQNIAQSTWGV